MNEVQSYDSSTVFSIVVDKLRTLTINYEMFPE